MSYYKFTEKQQVIPLIQGIFVSITINLMLPNSIPFNSFQTGVK